MRSRESEAAARLMTYPQAQNGGFQKLVRNAKVGGRESGGMGTNAGT